MKVKHQGRVQSTPKRYFNEMDQCFEDKLDPKEKLLKIALANSKMDYQQQEFRKKKLPQAHIYYPSVEEFADPIKYIRSIQHEASQTGICKIVPPKDWNPPFAIDIENNPATFLTRLQKIHTLQEGKSYENGRQYTLSSYRKQANDFYDHWLQKKNWKASEATIEKLEKEYWRLVETGCENTSVEYANDLDTTVVGSGFVRKRTSSNPQNGHDTDVVNANPPVNFSDPDYYATCGWNLNNFSGLSLLQHVLTKVNGINVPWLYCGMLFSTFCWHTEDNYLPSINYMHLGASKVWYGIPTNQSASFERVMHNSVPLRFVQNPDLLLHLVTMVPPSKLVSNSVDVYTLIQNPGDIILTFPRAYHAGFSSGFNCAEAVNFAVPEWIVYGRECSERYREFGRLSVFSHDRLIYIIASQDLSQYSKSNCVMLLDEMLELEREEISRRRELIRKGMRKGVKMDDFSESSCVTDEVMNEDDHRQCLICKHNCFFSGVACPCTPSHISCLRHAHLLCSCPLKRKYFLLWVNLEKLSATIDKIRQHIATTAAPEDDFEKKSQDIKQNLHVQSPLALTRLGERQCKICCRSFQQQTAHFQCHMCECWYHFSCETQADSSGYCMSCDKYIQSRFLHTKASLNTIVS